MFLAGEISYATISQRGPSLCVPTHAFSFGKSFGSTPVGFCGIGNRRRRGGVGTTRFRSENHPTWVRFDAVLAWRRRDRSTLWRCRKIRRKSSGYIRAHVRGIHQAALSARDGRLERNPLAFVEAKKGRESRPGNRTRANSIAKGARANRANRGAAFHASCRLDAGRQAVP